MEPDFATDLDDLITKHKAREVSLDLMIADMLGAIDGLNTELRGDDDE